jgi:hypothetical protein
VVSITGLVGLLLCGLLTYWVVQSNDAETRRDCERAVAARDDSRAMWLYLLEKANPDRSPEEQKRYDEFTVELDNRLPPLRCDGDNWVPDRSKLTPTPTPSP